MRPTSIKLNSVLLLLASAAPCLAQAAAGAASEKGYVASYFIVGLGVALGLVAVCRTSKRRADVRKPE